MRRFSVPLAYVDGAKLATLALDPFRSRDEASLLDCLVNREQVAACLAQPGQRFCHGGDVREAAVIEIQAGARMALGRHHAGRLRHLRWAAQVLTRKGKVFAFHQATMRQLQVPPSCSLCWSREPLRETPPAAGACGGASCLSQLISTASGLGFSKVRPLEVNLHPQRALPPLTARGALAGRCPCHYPFALALSF